MSINSIDSNSNINNNNNNIDNEDNNNNNNSSSSSSSSIDSNIDEPIIPSIHEDDTQNLLSGSAESVNISSDESDEIYAEENNEMSYDAQLAQRLILATENNNIAS